MMQVQHCRYGLVSKKEFNKEINQEVNIYEK